MRTLGHLPRLLTVRNGLLVVAGVLCLFLIPWATQAAQSPHPSAQETPTPVPFVPALPYSAPGLHPPGMDPQGTGDVPVRGPGAAGTVTDPPNDRRPAQVLWPYPAPDYGLTVGGVNITSQWVAHGLGSGVYWFAATFQEVGGELQVRDVAPNTGPVHMNSGPISDGHEIFPRWLDILAGGHAWFSPYRSVFTMTVAQDIPSNAWDGMWAWPILDKYGNLLYMPLVYLGAFGWEHAISGPGVGQDMGFPDQAEARSAAVRRQADGWIGLEVALRVIPPLMDANWFWEGAHGMAAWFFDADANPSTGSPAGAEVMVEVWLNPAAKAYEALVKRWEGHRWVYKMTLQPPVVDSTFGTIRVRVGPATLALGTNFSWWVSTAMTIGRSPDIYITNEIDRVPDEGVVLEGPDFWVLPTRTPTRTPTPTATPGRLIVHGTVYYETSGELIAGATVWVEQKRGETWTLLGQTTSGKDGSYRLSFTVAGVADYRVHCRIAGPLGPREQTMEYAGVPPSPLQCDFVFQPIIRVRGQVVSGAGTPEPSTIVRKALCDYRVAGCVTWPYTWTDDALSSVVPLDAEGKFDEDAYFRWTMTTFSVRLKALPSAGQRVADVAVPSQCEALALDLVECANLKEGIYEGVKFVLGPALTPTPTPSPTPAGPWAAWTDPDGIPVGTAGRTLSFRFEALPYTGTLTITLGPGLEFTDGTSQKQWALRVLRGCMQVTVRAVQTHLGQQSWVRGTLLGMEDTLPVRLVWQTRLPGTFRHTGWRNYVFGVRFVDLGTGEVLHDIPPALEQCFGDPCRWQGFGSSIGSPDGNWIFEPEGLHAPYYLRMVVPTSVSWNTIVYALDHVDLDGPALWDPSCYIIYGVPYGCIIYNNPPSGRYVKNVVYMRRTLQ
ncbi:MAG: hypothetical protein Kow00123_10900 [Anaerolineales bacterium]